MTKFETKTWIDVKLRRECSLVSLILLIAGAGCSGSHCDVLMSASTTRPSSTTLAVAQAAPKRAVFIDTYEEATTIVYLCDASATMLPAFGNLKAKLKDSVNALSLEGNQKFNVIFCSDGNIFPLFKDEAHMPTGDNKRLAMNFIDSAIPTGTDQPIPSIKFAMAEKPDLLYVLSDGFSGDSTVDDAVRELRNDNIAGKTHVNCIFFQTDTDPKFAQTMKTIAADGHGVIKKVLVSDM